MWPKTPVGSRATLFCQLNGSLAVTRDCLNGGVWAMAAYGGCALLGLIVRCKILIIVHKNTLFSFIEKQDHHILTVLGSIC